MRKETLGRLSAALTVAAGAASYGGYELLQGNSHPASLVGGEQQTKDAAEALKNAESEAASKYCRVSPLSVPQIETVVDPNVNNMIVHIGKTSTGGHVKFTSSNPSKFEDVVAKNVADNTPALAVIDTILSGTNSVNPGSNAATSYSTYKKMEAKESLRADICKDVVGRILDTNGIGAITTPTGTFDVFQDTFSGSAVSDIEALPEASELPEPNSSSQTLFYLTPVLGQKKAGQAEIISQSWGITALGQIIQAAETVGASSGGASASQSAPESTGGSGSGSAENDNNNDGEGSGASGITSGGNHPEGQPGSRELTPGSTTTSTTEGVITTTTTTIPPTTTTTTGKGTCNSTNTCKPGNAPPPPGGNPEQ